MTNQTSLITVERKLSGAQLTRRNKALQVAAELANELGYEQFTMQVVADRSGVTRPTLYRYFASKDALLAELIEVWAKEINHYLRQSPLQGKTDGEKVADAFSRIVCAALSQPLLTESVLGAMLSLDVSARKKKRQLLSIIQGYIEIATGKPAPLVAMRVLSHTLFSVLIGLTHEDLDKDEAIETLSAAAIACFH